MCEWQTQSPGLMQIADAQEFTEPYFEPLSINGQRNEIRPNPHLRETLKRSPTAGAALGVLVAFPPNATGVTLASVGRKLAEFVEVANRVGGLDAARALAGKRSGKQFDSELAALLRDDADALLGGLDSIVTWDVVIDAEPAL